jgi:lipopolysaccharide transport system ATP-binding protein
VIRAESLGKKYRIGALHKKHDTLRDSIAAAFKRPNGETFKRSSDDEFWALRDVSFEVKRGEVVGIIGRNGAGKSTLLKILSKITEPSAGRVELRGRVGSLLEVGTGFHPELSGRENIFLNGAILGMGRAEIRRRFDEIAAFAEVEKFIDTPVKHYSSGMYMRLAFAVAAHLEAEVLLMDEVLAVGDSIFQRKCLGKMAEVSHDQGRTVVFVSHNMQAVRQLCDRCFLLTEGRITDRGDVEHVTTAYLRGSQVPMDENAIDQLLRGLPVDPVFELDGLSLHQDGEPVRQVMNGKQLDVILTYRVKGKSSGLRVFIDLLDAEGALLFRSFHDGAHGVPTVVQPGSYRSVASIPRNILGPVDYVVSVQAGIFNKRMCLPQDGIRIPISVVATTPSNDSYLSDTFRGKLAPQVRWKTDKL